MVISKSRSETYVTEIYNGKDTIYSDVNIDKGGSGKYFRPHDLIESGYAACLHITTRMVLDSMKVTYDEVTVQVELKRDDETKTIFNYHIDIIGEIDEEIKKVVLNKVKNCPVRKTLSKPLEFKSS